MRSHARLTLRFAALSLALSLLTPGRTLAVDGTWSRPQILEGVQAGVTVYDSARDRMIVIGGQRHAERTQDVWVSPMSGTPDWHALATAGTKPSARTMAAAIYDPVRDRVLLIGGDVPDHATLWSLALSGPGAPVWSALGTAGPVPAPGRGAQFLYDAARDRALLVTGSAAPNLDVRPLDLWTLSLTGTPTWALLNTGTVSPELDTENLFVGLDSGNDRLVAVGFTDKAFAGLCRAATLDLGGLHEWHVAPTPGAVPPARRWQQAVLDPANHRVLMHGGLGNAGWLSDVWQLSLNGTFQWSALSLAGAQPGGRGLAHAIYDPTRARMVMFGGSPAGPDQITGYPQYRADTWALALSGTAAWQELAPDAPRPPSTVWGHTLTYDARRDRIVSIGGSGSPAMPGCDVFTVAVRTPDRWSHPVTTGTPPPARFQHTATYDGARDRIVVIGGINGATGNLTDVWELSLATMHWTELHPTGAPAGTLSRHTAILDPARDRIVVYRDSHVNELTLGNAPAWSELTTAGTPPPTFGGHSAILDPARDRMIVFGGDVEPPFGYYSDETGGTWALSLSSPPTWTALATGSRRSNHSAVYDEARDRMVVHGGSYSTFVTLNSFTTTNATQAFSLANGTWSDLTTDNTPSRRMESGAIYDPVQDGLWVFAGSRDNADGNQFQPLTSDLWTLRFTATLDAPGAGAGPRLLSASAYPNPARDAVAIRCAIPSAAPSLLRVFDAQGRVVRTILDASLTPGTHTLRWDTHGTDGRPSPAGLYFYELRNGAERRVQRLVLLR